MNREQAMQLINAYMAGYGTIAKPQAVTFVPRDVTIHNEEAEPMALEQPHKLCAKLTADERKAVDEAMRANGENNTSEAVRKALAMYCEAADVKFPHTPRNWGGERTPKS